jgi:hypothetical protein
MTTTITMVTMKADRAKANANPVAVIGRKSTHYVLEIFQQLSFKSAQADGPP